MLLFICSVIWIWCLNNEVKYKNGSNSILAFRYILSSFSLDKLRYLWFISEVSVVVEGQHWDSHAASYWVFSVCRCFIFLYWFWDFFPPNWFLHLVVKSCCRGTPQVIRIFFSLLALNLRIKGLLFPFIQKWLWTVIGPWWEQSSTCWCICPSDQYFATVHHTGNACIFRLGQGTRWGEIGVAGNHALGRWEQWYIWYWISG